MVCGIIASNGEDATRRRRYSENPAKRLWYARHRALRFREKYFGDDMKSGGADAATTSAPPGGKS